MRGLCLPVSQHFYRSTLLVQVDQIVVAFTKFRGHARLSDAEVTELAISDG
ncbi:hypothetical protein Poly59_24290 [Rubripirellula reticaptiva]|uniref:Uncharacterized protein n=1 Tax=Rubripirellula reticaptiva TaxID=2528013 RepID=A0A5C6F4K0_9BACT|nr:hypothetical protein Poly59_24290 [Rubripirellula reticaptiva]